MKAKESPDMTAKSQGTGEVSSMTIEFKDLRTQPVATSGSKTKDLSSWVKARDAGESLMRAAECKDHGN